MKYTIKPLESGAWEVQAVKDDGAALPKEKEQIAVFSGLRAEALACEYAAFKGDQKAPS